MDEAQQLPWSVRVEHQEVFAVANRRHLAPPAGAEADRHRLVGIAVPVGLQVSMVPLRPALNSIRAERVKGMGK